MTLHSVLRTGTWAAAAGLALTVFAPQASAQPNGHGNDYRSAPQVHNAPSQYHSGASMPGRKPGHAQAHGRGAGPNHNLYRGGKLPPAWRGKHYVVDDWRGHRLSRPSRGQRWVQAGSDYLLVSNSSGLIAQIVLR